MNREIKFRGKDYNNKWRYGDLVQEKWGKGKAIMIKKDTTAWTVLEDTVGQYTGLHDKNGKEIYEGDIVYCQTKYGKAKALIEFIDGKFVAYWNSAITHPQNGHHIACYDINKKFEVIGNVFENPELLGGEDER